MSAGKDDPLARLKRAAATYLSRYAASSAQLRTVLDRQVRRRARRRGEDAVPALAQLDAAVAFCVEHGLVDDAAYAKARAQTLRQRGWPARRIALALRQKGLDAELVAAALRDMAGPDEELSAARRFAERRRLGPWRSSDDRVDRRQKDIAAMLRAGFGSTAARQAIDEDK